METLLRRRSENVLAVHVGLTALAGRRGRRRVARARRIFLVVLVVVGCDYARRCRARRLTPLRRQREHHVKRRLFHRPHLLLAPQPRYT
eukprot:8223638-Alexandrium_andersonii.AAC.1